jgi:hypothetical protein
LASSELIRATVSDVEDQSFAVKVEDSYNGRTHPWSSLAGKHLFEQPSVGIGDNRRDIGFVACAINRSCDRLDDDATGYLAAFVPAHSVRDHGPAVTACEGSRPAFDRIPANPVTYEI